MTIGIKGALEAAKMARVLKGRGVSADVAERVSMEAVKRGETSADVAAKEGHRWFDGKLGGMPSERRHIREFVRAGRVHELKSSSPGTLKKD